MDLAQKRGVQICLSNPCFEVWFLARFERSARSYEGFKGVKLALNKYWKEPFGHVYDKTDEAIYRRIHKQTETAICNAKWAREKHHGKKARTADCNSSTEVYVLVEELLGR